VGGDKEGGEMNARKYTNGVRDWAGEKDARIQELKVCVADLLEACEMALITLQVSHSFSFPHCIASGCEVHKVMKFLTTTIAKAACASTKETK